MVFIVRMGLIDLKELQMEHVYVSLVKVKDLIGDDMKSLNKYNAMATRHNEIIDMFDSATPRKQKKLQKEFTKIQKKLPKLAHNVKCDVKFRKEATQLLTLGAITSWII